MAPIDPSGSSAVPPPPFASQTTSSSIGRFPANRLSLSKKRKVQQPIEADFIPGPKRACLENKTPGRGTNSSLPSPQDALTSSKTMNGHSSGALMSGTSHKLLEPRFSNKSPPIAALCNLGNTCFLNSVLYTLRFTPGFLHSLHHMVNDLGLLNSNSSVHSKKRIVNGSTEDSNTELVHDVVDQMHDLFKTLSCADESPDAREPIPPSTFLNAVGKWNPMFEGNQQQDAHEFLTMIMTMLQDIRIPAAPSDSLNEDQSSHDSNRKEKGKKKAAKFLNSNGHSSLGNPSTGNTIPNGVSSVGSKVKNGSDEAKTLPNFVKENFVGKSVMQTRCLECELSTYRSETFMNIDIPLQFDDENDDDLSGKDLFLKQILASETLRENNKYWCEECSRLNEAQRSVQYQLLPKVMILQLKRFTATGSKTYMSKINDYIPTPFTMNCFCTQCMPQPGETGGGEQKHHYRLFAVIMHLGATLASGHYIAYVRATDPSWEYLQCQRGNSVERKNKKGIMKYFSRSSDSRNGNSNSGSSVGNNGSNSGTDSPRSGITCRSDVCCGMRVLNVSLENNHAQQQHHQQQQQSYSSLGVHNHGGGHRGTSLDSMDSSSVTSDTFTNGLHVNGSMGSSGSSGSSSNNSGNVGTSSAAVDTSVPEDLWLECDDESIGVITRKQFQEVLSAKQGATTPYLLFYQKL